MSLYCRDLSNAIALLSPSDLPDARKGLLLPFAIVDITKGTSAIFVCNTFLHPIMLLRGECIGTVEAINEEQVIAVPDDTCSASYPNLSAISSTSAQLPSNVFDSSIAGILTVDRRSQLLSLLEEFSFLFTVGQPCLDWTSTVMHHIDTGSQPPLHQRPYHVSPTGRRVINEQVNDMHWRKVIQPSRSPRAFLVILVTKKNGFVWLRVHYQWLDKFTRKDVYPLTRIGDAIESLQEAEFFSYLDLRSGY